MSKEYELLQMYPGLPEDWKVGEIVVPNVNGYYEDVKGNHTAPKRHVENNPEHWGKVEKDYEILSFTLNASNEVIPIKQKGVSFTSNIEEYLNRIDADVHSVKRLSDEKIFTVNDDVKNYYPGLYKGIQETNKWTVNSIQIRNGKCILFDGFGIKQELKDVYHREKPLFISDDGYEIYKGDKYFYTLPELRGNKIYSNSAIDGSRYKRQDLKHFKHKKNAEKWIENNEAIYSENDVRRALSEIRDIKSIDKMCFWKSLNSNKKI